jgi:hypothetical protein
MPEATPDTGQPAASGYLKELLLGNNTYRSAWEKYATRTRPGIVNQVAVADVLARHLRAEPRTPADVEITSQQLKDTVSRAMTGRMLSRESLALFIDAFGISRHEAARLWALYGGSARIAVMKGSQVFTPLLDQSVVATLPPRRHQALSLHDHIWVGPDGRLDRARHQMVIEAIEHGCDRLTVITDFNVQTIELGQGCKEFAGVPYRQVGPGAFATDILLTRELDLGETLPVEFFLSCRWPPDAPLGPMETSYRRGTLRVLHNVDLRVEFHPDCLPESVWWAHWENASGEVIHREQVTLDSQHSAHRHLRTLEKTLAGFYWELREQP